MKSNPEDVSSPVDLLSLNAAKDGVVLGNICDSAKPILNDM